MIKISAGILFGLLASGLASAHSFAPVTDAPCARSLIRAAELIDRLSARDAGPAYAPLSAFDLETLKDEADFEEIGFGVYRVVLARQDGPIYGVLRVMPNRERAEYERWSSELFRSAPHVLASPIRVLESTPRFAAVMRKVFSRPSHGFQSDVIEVVDAVQRGETKFWLTLALFLPGRTGLAYLSEEAALMERLNLLSALHAVSGALEDRPHSTRDRPEREARLVHLIERLSHSFASVTKSSAVTGIIADLKPLLNFDRTGLTTTQIISKILHEAALTKSSHYDALAAENIFTTLPKEVRSQLAAIWAAAYVAGIKDLHNANWLEHLGRILAIDLNYSPGVWSEGAIAYAPDTLMGGPGLMGSSFIKLIINAFAPETLAWIQSIAAGACSVDYSLGLSPRVEGGVRGRARWLLDQRTSRD